MPFGVLSVTPEQESAIYAFDRASSAIKECKPNDGANEGRYGVTYQRLVTLGLAPKLRKKYR